MKWPRWETGHDKYDPEQRCLMIWAGDDRGLSERDRMFAAGRQRKRRLLGFTWPVVGFWLVEYSRRLHFQPRLCIVQTQWKDGSENWSTYISFFGFMITHWPKAEYRNASEPS